MARPKIGGKKKQYAPECAEHTVTWMCRDLGDFDDLLADLRAMRKEARHTGGEHRVFRTNPDGSKFVVNLMLPHRQCAVARKR